MSIKEAYEGIRDHIDLMREQLSLQGISLEKHTQLKLAVVLLDTGTKQLKTELLKIESAIFEE